MRDFSLEFDRTRVVRKKIAGRSRVVTLKVTYHVTKNPNNSGEIGASVSIGNTPVQDFGEFQKITLRRWVFSIRFFGVFRGSCLKSVNGNIVTGLTFSANFAGCINMWVDCEHYSKVKSDVC